MATGNVKNTAVIQLLLDYGADKAATNNDGLTAAGYDRTNGLHDIANFIENYRASIKGAKKEEEK